jgi:hypothetical protein
LESERGKLRAAVGRLGHESFAVREKATRELEQAGRSALRLLRPAAADADPEVARRARRCIEAIEAEADLAGPAVRVLAARKPAGAVEALLACAPFADEAAEEDLRQAVAALGRVNGKAVPALVTALADAEPARRALAVGVVGRAADPTERRAAARLLDDPDAAVRFQAAAALLSARDRAAVATLIALLTDGPPETAARAEDLLVRLAGEQAPPVGLDATSSRRRCRATWEQWWKANGDNIDLATMDAADGPLGLTLVCEAQRPGGCRVFECGRDGKPRWTLPVLDPIDAHLLPGGRVLVAESDAHRVVEMNRQGRVLWSYAIPSPVCCQRLANGNTFIGSRGLLAEVTRDGKTVFAVPRGGYYAQKLRNGHILCIDVQGVVLELDTAGNEIHRINVGGGTVQSWACVEALANGRYLVALGAGGKVLEIDHSGKVFWEVAVRNPNSAVRLANGNTLVASHDDQFVYEFDRTGKEVWRRGSEGRPFRARRR